MSPTAAALNPRSDGFVADFSAFLLTKGAIDELPLRRAEKAQRQSGERFDLVLTRLGLVTEPDMARLLAAFLDLGHLAPGSGEPLVALPAGLDMTFVADNRIVPLAEDGETLHVAVADPFQTDAVAALSYLLGRHVRPFVTTAAEVQRMVETLRGHERADAHSATDTGDVANDEDIRRLTDLASEAPVIRLVQDLIVRAVEQQASDIHMEPREDCLRIRFRLDGMLHTVEQLPPSLRAAVTSRVKIMASLDIAERRMPQDGRMRAIVHGRQIDLRVSTVPTMVGESVVLRILDRASIELDFSSLGFEGATRQRFETLLQSPNGILLVTGPTGSGKTTTLYTALRGLNREDNKVFTVEDPVEYQLPGVNQMQIQPRIGLTFAHALRSILRQDPDIIMVGEIRDLETADMAVQASLTGHLVLSTVHTNSAAATVARLTDMGVERFLLASAMKGILAQRLVRRLCAACAETMPLPGSARRLYCEAGLADAAGADATMKRAKGCKACRNTGYRGRTVITELLAIDDQIRERIQTGTTEREIAGVARQGGMLPMYEDGLLRVLAGDTTLEEVLRVTQAA